MASGDIYRGLTFDACDDRCHVALGMVASLDGASEIDGVSGPLGGNGDRTAFRRLRDACDVILVGARTAQAEHYRPPVAHELRQADRLARGLAAVPRLAIVTRSGRIDRSLPVFGNEDHPPLVITGGDSDTTTLANLGAVAELIRIDGVLTMGAVLDVLWERSLPRVLCEGGPTLNNMLLTADLIDEIFMTVAPIALGGSAARIITGDGLPVPRAFSCVGSALVDGDLLLHYLRDHSVDARRQAQ